MSRIEALAARVAAVASDAEAEAIVAELDRIEFEGPLEERRDAYDLLIQLGAQIMSDGRWYHRVARSAADE